MLVRDGGSVDTASSAQVFDLLDVNNDGVLTKLELSNLADALFTVGVTHFLVGRRWDDKRIPLK